LRLVLAALAAGMLSVGAASPAPAAETCPNATLREQNKSTELPECRAYEMVSSPYKQGFDLQPQTFSDDGIVSYESTGSFAGNGNGGLANQYLGVRTPEGWETRSLNPPLASYVVSGEWPPIFASGMRSSVNTMSSREQPGEGERAYVRDFNGTFTRVGTGPIPPSPEGFSSIVRVLDGSDDLSRLVMGGYTLWSGLEYFGVGSVAVLRYVNVDNNGVTLPGGACHDAISRDGRVEVFSAGCPGRVWARLGGAVTVLVSGSECTRGPLDPGGVCNGLSPASYAGSAADGSRVFFTTAQQLVNGDTDSSTDLYACDIPPGTPAPVGTANPCASLTEVSGTASGANVQSVVKVSEDGSRVYFVAEGAVLAGNPGANDETAVAGNHNLYVWTRDSAHPEGQTTFVGAIDANGITGAQTTADGRYLVFSTTSSLVSSGPGADTDGGADMYRYDAESQTMQRVSTSITGSGGNDPGFDAISRMSQRGSVPSQVSADGSMVVFQTAEALSPQDTDGVSDVYLWHDGRVSLISHGGELPWIDVSGQNLYFVTDRPLSAADRDVNVDIYDARVDGGFDLSSSPPCSGEACQGQPSTPPAAAATPGSQTLQGAGNPPQAVVVEKATTKPLARQQKLAKALKQCRKKPKHKRVACERQARKRYAPVNKSARRSHR
jgi:ribosomal protein L39E